MPELSLIGHRLGVPEVVWSWCFLAGERPAAGRAATTRLWFLHLPAMTRPTAVAVLCSMDFPARRIKVKTEEVLPVTATRSGEANARSEALTDAELFALVTPNV